MGRTLGDPLYGGTYDDVHPAVRAFAATLPPGLRVIDLGSGDGRHALFHAGLDHDVLAIDQDAELAKVSRSKALLYGSARMRFRVEVADITGPILDGEAYDVVVCTFVLQDMAPAEVAATIRAIRRLTAHGGLCIVTAYTGNEVQRRIARSTGLLAEGEIARNFDQAGWALTIRDEDPGAYVIQAGEKRRWPCSVVVARRPPLDAPDARSARDLLQRRDPEAFEDETLYGVG